VLERFFTGYDRAFVLPHEREELAGFRDCLALNERYRHAFGRTHCELVVTFSDPSGVLLGGANFLATALDCGIGTPRAAIALNYVFVETAARGRGLLRRIIALVRSLALKGIDLPIGTGQPGPAIFIEQNDPLKMSAEDYRRDTEHSGMDQIDRLAIWSRVGARIVDFPYIQPALSPDQAPDDGLVYAAVDYPGAAVPARVLHDHLESFFGISVLKGKSLATDPVATAQLELLSERDAPIALLCLSSAINGLRDDPTRARGCASLRAFARRGEDGVNRRSGG
jgi:hypothetical protein